MATQPDLIWTIKRGETGAVRTATLSDASGAVDLTNKTLVMNVRETPNGPKWIDAAAVTKAANQTTTGMGQISVTFSEAMAAIPAATYLLEFKATEGSVISYFPLDDDEAVTYGWLIVQPSLG